MEIHECTAKGFRFSLSKEGKEITHAYLYIFSNDLHDVPFGLLEDVHVEEACRGAGLGRELLREIIARAQAEKCYKLVATSRNDGTRQSVHDWYVRLGFRNYGTEFRVDFR